MRLTRFLQEKIKSMEALKDPPKPLFSEKDTLQTYCKKQEQRIQNDPRSKNLGSHSSEKKTNVNLETEECAVLAMSKGDRK